MPSIAAGAAQSRYQSIDDTIVQLFISQASVLITRGRQNSIGIVTTRNGRRNSFLFRE